MYLILVSIFKRKCKNMGLLCTFKIFSQSDKSKDALFQELNNKKYFWGDEQNNSFIINELQNSLRLELCWSRLLSAQMNQIFH